jgi:hypothetical protein
VPPPAWSSWSRKAKAFKRDSDIGYALGLQAAASCKTSTRMPRLKPATATCAPMQAREMTGSGKAGSLDLHKAGQLHLGASYKF